MVRLFFVIDVKGNTASAGEISRGGVKKLFRLIGIYTVGAAVLTWAQAF